MLRPHNISDTTLQALYTLSVLIFTKFLRDSKFILVIEMTQLETPYLNTGFQKEPQFLIRLLLSVSLPLRITAKVIQCQALGTMVYTLYIIYLFQ